MGLEQTQQKWWRRIARWILIGALVLLVAGHYSYSRTMRGVWGRKHLAWRLGRQIALRGRWYHNDPWKQLQGESTGAQSCKWFFRMGALL